MAGAGGEQKAGSKEKDGFLHDARGGLLKGVIVNFFARGVCYDCVKLAKGARRGVSGCLLQEVFGKGGIVGAGEFDVAAVACYQRRLQAELFYGGCVVGDLA